MKTLYSQNLTCVYKKKPNKCPIRCFLYVKLFDVFKISEVWNIFEAYIIKWHVEMSEYIDINHA